jgi:hypothetical protein
LFIFVIVSLGSASSSRPSRVEERGWIIGEE